MSGGPNGTRPPRGSSPELLYPAPRMREAVLPTSIGQNDREVVRVEKHSPRCKLGNYWFSTIFRAVRRNVCARFLKLGLFFGKKECEEICVFETVGREPSGQE